MDRAGACTSGNDDDGWYERLDVLTNDLQRNASLTPLGLTIAHGQLVAALASRVRLARLWQHHPEIDSAAFPRPIIIVGQMRSGSTRMQRLMACDRQFAHTRFFESWNPVPRWPTWRWIDDRRLRGRLGLGLASLLNPEFSAIHPTKVDAPDEEIGLLAPSIFGAGFEAQWRVPRFARHCEATDTTPLYRHFRRTMKTIAWQRGETRPWIMKMPQFAQDLPTVLTTFPDARVIFLGRPDATVV